MESCKRWRWQFLKAGVESWVLAGLLFFAAVGLSPSLAASDGLLDPDLAVFAAQGGRQHTCRLRRFANDVLCGQTMMALNPDEPAGGRIPIAWVVVPAMALHKSPDPVVFIAGGPGQSAIELAPQLLPLLAPLQQRRDLVFIDQRGTGFSAPLACPEALRAGRQLGERGESVRSKAASSGQDPAQVALLRQCVQQLQTLPHGQLQHYSTEIAVRDLDAVRAALGVTNWNMIGVSYGTRVGLEYLRQYPARVRRLILDGVAPAEMVMPVSSQSDGWVVFDQVLQRCEASSTCNPRFPALRARWQAFMASLPKRMAQPGAGSADAGMVMVTASQVSAAVRSVLYMPAYAAALPAVMDAATRGDLKPLHALSGSLQGGGEHGLWLGMHFSVVCAEDGARMLTGPAAAPTVDQKPSASTPGKVDRAELAAAMLPGQAAFYREVCQFWPHAAVSSAFGSVTESPAPVLLLSGGADPVTPPRHAQALLARLGPRARHEVIPNLGHGVLLQPCVLGQVERMIKAEDPQASLQFDLSCAQRVPPPLPYLPQIPPGAEGAGR